ncbi:MAG: dihydroorotate dehydrogenase electron transfer subunit [Bacteroidales bacterium]|nr:dihydroorotate dehydrogenase electron transfer subunit [Bacteroidales bacterium]MCM1147850.1 dihydroorotate dehydrogenase electron transfer subunit [Bacteroidales bacterium]MCM1206693.1 dihydroorotate dehydrogenase electron transfer subunit [Bacillota bacterium]MCM1510888.1 dihydroorotate dehydrogenase electron transfer subunit [Clostridium sp.]
MKKKHLLDLTVKSAERINEKYILIKLTDSKPLPEMNPGQFAELRIDGSGTTFLRRPISIHHVDYTNNELWLLVALVGDGTRSLARLKEGDTMNILLPLGNGFTVSPPCKSDTGEPYSVLLVGGGVGVAPLLYAGEAIKRNGGIPVFLLGARSKKDLLELDMFRAVGEVYVTTEDGSEGEKGFVTDHSIWNTRSFCRISVCGPKPMMLAVARLAREKETNCEVSLENKMACGLGACLCCVEDTKEGNVCVCKDGPVFSTDKLKW